MRRDIIKDVKIKEPPLEELTRKYSTYSNIKRSCLTGCGCLIFLLIALIIILKFALGVGPQQITAVPANFPADIPIYDRENITDITFISGKYKNRVIEIAAIFPKLILSPLISVLDKDMVDNQSGKKSTFKNMWKIINSPVSDQRDVIKIRWENLTAEPNFIYTYYQTEFKKKGYGIEAESQGQTEQQFSFSKQTTAGSFYLKMDSEKTNTILANLIVNYYPKASSTTTTLP